MSERRSSFGYEDLLACGREELFGPGNAQLPLPPMLMFDRITEIFETGGEHGKGYARAEFDIKPSLWFFDCHFKGNPVMPGCLGLDALWQMVGFYLAWLDLPGRGMALGVGEVKFTDMVRPEREVGHLWHRLQARVQEQARARHRRRLGGGRRRAHIRSQGFARRPAPRRRPNYGPIKESAEERQLMFRIPLQTNELRATVLGVRRQRKTPRGEKQDETCRRHRNGDRIVDRQ